MLTIERLGGLGGFGLPGSRITSRGEMPVEQLSAADQATVEDLFRKHDGAAPAPGMPDGFRYRITRHGKGGAQTIEVPEGVVPAALVSSVKDELK